MTKILLRRTTAASMPVLDNGEPGFATDTFAFYVGWSGVNRQITGGGGGAVSSVFGRTGVIAATSGDYSFSLISGTVAAAQLPVFVASGASHAKGAVPDPGAVAGITKYLREDGSWQVPPGTGGAGSVSSVGLAITGSLFTISGSPVTSSGTLTATINNASANIVFAGPASGAAAPPDYRSLVGADLPIFVASGASHAVGAVPDPGVSAGSTKFLREDATWQLPAIDIGALTSGRPTLANFTPYSTAAGPTNNRQSTADELLAILRPGHSGLRLDIQSDPYQEGVASSTTVGLFVYSDDRIVLYDGTGYRVATISGSPNVSVAALTTNLMYDIFGYYNAGNVSVEALAWTNNTSRATALTQTNGVWFKSGDQTRRYLGSFYTDLSGGTKVVYDTPTQRGVWNQDNRVHKRLYRTDSTATWSYNTATYRYANASSANAVYICAGRQAALIDLKLCAEFSKTTAGYGIAVIGEDATTGPAAEHIGGYVQCAANAYGFCQDLVAKAPVAGVHFYNWLESGDGAGGVQTWTSNSFMGLSGWWEC